MGSTSTFEDPSDSIPSADASDQGSSLPSSPVLCKRETDHPEVEMMKERFAKLLLGEDMSGGGRGVCTALAVSNAITNLSASVFGELWRLEPLNTQKKDMWRREMEWLLSICGSIVELVPSVQKFPGGAGGVFEVMTPRMRTDLRVNLPALRKLDSMLVGMLDGFGDCEFWYVDRGVLCGAAEEGGGGEDCPTARLSVRQEDKWWLPCPRVPLKGLSEGMRKKIQQCRDCANQVLKAALAINGAVLADMAVPQVYFETLPKSGKSCLGDLIYQYISADQFSPDFLLDCLDLSSEHQSLEIANCVEAAYHVWRMKSHRVHLPREKVKRSSWSGKVMGLVTDASKKSQFLAQRAECLLQSLRIRCPGLPQTLLDMNKIQFNKDVGQAVLESYSRVVESLAFNIIARIDDLIYVDDATKKCAASEPTALFNSAGLGCLPVLKRVSPSLFSLENTTPYSPVVTPRLCPSSGPVGVQSCISKINFGGHVDAKLRTVNSSDVERTNHQPGT